MKKSWLFVLIVFSSLLVNVAYRFLESPRNMWFYSVSYNDFEKLCPKTKYLFRRIISSAITADQFHARSDLVIDSFRFSTGDHNNFYIVSGKKLDDDARITLERYFDEFFSDHWAVKGCFRGMSDPLEDADGFVGIELDLDSIFGEDFDFLIILFVLLGNIVLAVLVAVKTRE